MSDWVGLCRCDEESWDAKSNGETVALLLVVDSINQRCSTLPCARVKGSKQRAAMLSVFSGKALAVMDEIKGPAFREVQHSACCIIAGCLLTCFCKNTTASRCRGSCVCSTSRGTPQKPCSLSKRALKAALNDHRRLMTQSGLSTTKRGLSTASESILYLYPLLPIRTIYK